MKAPLILSLAALVLSALALASTYLFPRAAEPLDVSPAAPAAPGPELLELRARVQTLSDRLDLLSLLAAREPSEQPLGRSVPAEEIESLREEVRELLTMQSTPGLEAQMESPVFKERLADTLEQLRREERLEALRAKLEHKAERLEAALPKYEQWLGLAPHQNEAMRRALEGKYDRETEVLRLWADGASDGVLGQSKSDNAQAFQDELAAFLTPEQLETYMAGWK
ncbi:MAG: hypothetical protein ACYTG2_13925 [Planctomycetota bacterium]|jgi:hypothetical protein